MDQQTLVDDLYGAIERLAQSVSDEPNISETLRRYARALPRAEPSESRLPAARPRPLGPERPQAFRVMLFHALDTGVLDGRGFDWIMLAERRALRSRAPRIEH